MQIKFKHIYIENFCGIKKLDTPIYDRTMIKGRNAVGKSTIRNAIFWVLYNKLADGSAPDGIRPHDENGVDIDFIEISVVLTLDVDGRKIELKKTQKQKWTKPHGQQEKRFDGNVNEFEINGIPKKEVDYKKFIEENIALMETLMYCTNAMAFLGLDNKKRRAKLLSLEKEFSDTDVVATDKKYTPLADMLKDGTVDELIARSKKVIKAKNDELKTIPARIDELEKQKVDIDVAELELGRKALQEQIAENNAKQEDISKQYEEYQNLSDGVLELKFELNDLQRKANESLEKQRGDIGSEQWDKQKELGKIEQQIKLNKQDIERAENSIKRNEEQRQMQFARWNTANERVFDESSLICPYCCRAYEKDKQEEMRIEFENHKAEELKSITDIGTKLKEAIDKDKGEIKQLKATLAENEKSKIELGTQIAELETRYKELPQSIDISDTEEYKAIQSQIAEKEAAMEHGNSADEIRQTLKAEAEELQSQLTEIEKQIAKSENNAKLDDRIEELHAEQREISQKVADEEKTLDLLEDFNRAKVNMLTDRVNRHFELVKWQMFKPLINGSWEPCCEPLVNGASYYGLLNHGAKLLSEADVCLAFQKSAGIKAPVILDDTESIDTEKIPELDTQVILLRRTDETKLMICEG